MLQKYKKTQTQISMENEQLLKAHILHSNKHALNQKKFVGVQSTKYLGKWRGAAKIYTLATRSLGCILAISQLSF